MARGSSSRRGGAAEDEMEERDRPDADGEWSSEAEGTSAGSDFLPHAFWFRWSFRAPRAESFPEPPPAGGGGGDWLKLPESGRLPDVASLRGEPGWAEIRVAWREEGLLLTVEAAREAAFHPDQAGLRSGISVWVDTRDTRDIHRASRFCHRFDVTLEPGGTGKGKREELRATARLSPIARAMGNPPAVACGDATTPARARRWKSPGGAEGWRLELGLRAKALNGYDPEVNRRLGFMIRVTDPLGEDQYLGVGRDFPIGEDPSLWSSLILAD